MAVSTLTVALLVMCWQNMPPRVKGICGYCELSLLRAQPALMGALRSGHSASRIFYESRTNSFNLEAEKQMLRN